MSKTCLPFSSKKAREFLIKNGWVFTFRRKDLKLGDVWINSGRGMPKLADAQVVWRTKAKYHYGTLKPLEYFVDGSGFESALKWLDEIEKLNNGIPQDGWIYLVILRCEYAKKL